MDCNSFSDLYSKDSSKALEFAEVCMRYWLLGPLLGYIMGRFAAFWLKNIDFDVMLECVLALSFGFLTFSLGSILIFLISYKLILNYFFVIGPSHSNYTFLFIKTVYFSYV